jgi:hypothetical protein
MAKGALRADGGIELGLILVDKKSPLCPVFSGVVPRQE